VPFLAQGGRGNAPAIPAAPAAPTPHLPNGHVNFSSPPGEHGIWAPAGINQLYVFPFSVNRASAATQLPNAIREENVPFQPWARALHNTRELNIESDEPHTRCKASPGPREFITPYGVEIVELQELQRIFIFDIGGPHTFRTIYMDARPHPKDLDPSWSMTNLPPATTVTGRVRTGPGFWATGSHFDKGGPFQNEEEFGQPLGCWSLEPDWGEIGRFLAPWR